MFSAADSAGLELLNLVNATSSSPLVPWLNPSINQARSWITGLRSNYPVQARLQTYSMGQSHVISLWGSTMEA